MAQALSECDAYPRLLMVNGEPLNEQSAMGISLVSFFGGWPPERLAQLFTARIHPQNSSSRNWRLDTLSRCGREVSRVPVETLVEGARSRVVARPAQSGAVASVRSVARTGLDLVPYLIPAGFHKTMRGFRPEAIYSCLGSIQMCSLATRLAKTYGIPIVPHFTDDWISTMYQGKAWLAVHRLALLRAVSAVIRHARMGVTVTELMAEEYTAKFGIPFHAFMNPLNVPAVWPNFEGMDSRGRLRFVYVGGLHLRRWQSLLEIGDALLDLQQLKGVHATLDIYAPAADLQEYGARLVGPTVRVAGSLRQEQVFAAMLGGDVLVHVESFDSDMRASTRLSMSTKISQYMAAGRPLLCYAPGEVTSSRYVVSTQSGIAVGVQDHALLRDALSRLCQDPYLRMKLGRQGWAMAKQHHDTAAVRTGFRAVLAQAAWGAGRPVSVEAYQ
jgi:glycosyltransferase involved in cell wall biosynthesis